MPREIIDISMEIREDMQVYKNNESRRPKIFTDASFENGDSYHQSSVKLDLHCGTHMDRPLHMIKDGPDTDSYDIGRMVRPCKVFDMTWIPEGKIGAEHLEDLDIRENDFIILKSRNSFFDTFDENFVSLSESGAALLAGRKIDGVGVDRIGIEREEKDHATHRILLERDIVILEGLRLANVSAGDYFLICLPIKIRGVEGAPCRAVLTRG